MRWSGCSRKHPFPYIIPCKRMENETRNYTLKITSNTHSLLFPITILRSSIIERLTEPQQNSVHLFILLKRTKIIECYVFVLFCFAWPHFAKVVTPMHANCHLFYTNPIFCCAFKVVNTLISIHYGTFFLVTCIQSLFSHQNHCLSLYYMFHLPQIKRFLK